MHGRRADHEPQSARTGYRSPEGAHERAYPGRITKGRSAHVRDEQNRTLVQDREQVLPDRIGIRHIYFYGQRNHRYPSDPQHETTFTRHKSPPSAYAKDGEPRLWTLAAAIPAGPRRAANIIQPARVRVQGEHGTG